MIGTSIPRISVIVPVYKAELFIDKCLNSIIKQTFTDFEIILVDDNSPDKCPEICEEYAYRDDRIRVIHNKTNQGSSLSRKIGIDDASGTYIQFIDCDDWVETNMLEHLYLMAVSDNADIVWHDFFDFNGNHRKQNIDFSDKINIYKNLFDGKSNIISALWNKFTRKDILLHIVFPKAMLWEDMAITVQLVNYAKKINYIAEPFYHHMYNTSSISQNRERKARGLSEIMENLTITINYCREYLGPDYIYLEPELSACVNRFKFESLFIKELRNSEILLQLYPESAKNIFNSAWKTEFYKKLFLYAFVKKVPGFSKLYDLVQCVRY